MNKELCRMLDRARVDLKAKKETAKRESHDQG